jgi:hypothetical protein
VLDYCHGAVNRLALFGEILPADIVFSLSKEPDCAFVKQTTSLAELAVLIAISL